MPYIKSNNGRRETLQRGKKAKTAGELNYQIFFYVKHNPIIDSQIIKRFIDGFLGKKRNYQRYNDMTGCLIRCQKEIKRRLNRNVRLCYFINLYDNEIDKYEDLKILQNSDVE